MSVDNVDQMHTFQHDEGGECDYWRIKNSFLALSKFYLKKRMLKLYQSVVREDTLLPNLGIRNLCFMAISCQVNVDDSLKEVINKLIVNSSTNVMRLLCRMSSLLLQPNFWEQSPTVTQNSMSCLKMWWSSRIGTIVFCPQMGVIPIDWNPNSESFIFLSKC